MRSSNIIRSIVVSLTLSLTSIAQADAVDPSALRGKVLCGYQGWFRCPGDATDLGWIHYSRDRKRLTPDTVSFEMWPDMSEYGPGEKFAVPGFVHASGQPAHLFSSDNADTVLRHFTWMKEHGIDGVWLQQFAVELPGAQIYPSRERILNHVRTAAGKTGRVWAMTYDVTGARDDRVVDAITGHWKSLIDRKLIDDRYVRQDGLPVVEIWGIYPGKPNYPLTPESAGKLLDFFRTPGPYAAYVVGGGDWQWRKTFTPEWREVLKRFHAWMPWNVANYSTDKQGVRHASMGQWADDKKECEALGVAWIPVVYPGFSWDNLQKTRGGQNTLIPRRGGEFLWEQFVKVAELQPHNVFVAMFDEVDEGTAIFKVTNDPPTAAKFLTYDGLPADWYLKLTGEGTRLFRGERKDKTIPKPPTP